MNEIQHNRWRWFAAGMIAGPILLFVLAFGTMRLWLPALGEALVMTPHEGPADAIVVLGGGGPERVMHGIQLYRRGMAPRLWFTGNRPVSEMISFNEGQLSRELALREGIPAEAIALLDTGSTWEDGQRIAAMVKQAGLRRIILVTNWYHSRRALAVVRRHLAGQPVQIDYSPPPSSADCPRAWWTWDEPLTMVINEWIKMVLYLVKYKLAPV